MDTSQKYQVISIDDQKWLKPIDVPYPNADQNDDGWDDEAPFALADAVLYKQLTQPLLYHGRKPIGVIVMASEIEQVMQWKQKSAGDWIGTKNKVFFKKMSATIDHETRTVYIDSTMSVGKQVFCRCKDVKPSSYGRQIWLHAPAHMPKDNGYCIDLCIAQEIMQLWMQGITTTGCCCGHNVLQGYIGVEPKDSKRMLDLGYMAYDHPDDQPGYFIPKYDRLL